MNNILENQFQKYNKFFSKDGVTMSEANHWCNIIKERNTSTEGFLKTCKAYSYIVEFDGTKMEVEHSPPLPKIEEWMSEGQGYGISAWFREAIKAKEDILQYLRTCDESAFVNDDEVDSYKLAIRPTHEVVKCPVAENYVSVESDAYHILNVSELSEYLMVSAQAAHIGKYIHKNGIMQTIKNDAVSGGQSKFVKVLRQGQPTEYPANAHSTFLSREQVKEMYYKLQEKHREFESKANMYKARLNDYISTENVKIALRNKKKLEEYNAAISDFNAARGGWKDLLNSRRFEQIGKYSSYKIAIPNDYKPLIEKILQPF